MPAPGFLLGANLPWIDYGLDFGANAWRREGGVARCAARERERLVRELVTLREAGIETLRWFLFCDGRAGVRFDGGDVAGLDDFVFPDIDAALELADRAGLNVMFVLLDFHWCRRARRVDGVQLGGHANVLRNPGARAHLLDLVFRPVLERYGRSPTIFAWDVMNEPEWARPRRLRDFFSEAITLVHSCAVQPVTIGSAGLKWAPSYRDLNLDFYQVHWYDSLRGQPDLATPVEALGLDRPVMLGEFPTRGSRRSPREILQTARAAGYVGAFYWSLLADDQSTDRSWRLQRGPSEATQDS